MPDSDRAGLRGRLIQSFATLPGMNDPGQRAFLLESAGYGESLQHVAPATTTVSFFTSVVAQVARDGPRALADFVRALAAVAVVGVDRKEAMARLADEVARLDPADLDALTATGTPFAGLRERARRTTLREISEIGSKYLRELYFRHHELEDRVEEFLANDSTCLLVVSKPGRGKTNLLCSLAERRLDDSPVLLMSARVPVSEPHGLLSLIATRLGYGTDWPGCFADLARTAAPGRPPLLLLDAINESPAKPDAMKAALHELLRQAESAGVKVVVTCRTDFWQFYRAPFWASYVWQREPAQSGPRATPRPGSRTYRSSPSLPSPRSPPPTSAPSASGGSCAARPPSAVGTPWCCASCARRTATATSAWSRTSGSSASSSCSGSARSSRSRTPPPSRGRVRWPNSSWTWPG